MSQVEEAEQIESDNEFFEMSGPMPSAWDDHRRHPRFYYRSCAEALIYPLRGGQEPAGAMCFLLTRDLSRSGLSLVHVQQLFPGQKLDVSLNGGPLRSMEVVWCKRWSENRYLIGCRFVSNDTAEAIPPSDPA